jgi:hypothetical protein
MLEDLDAGKAHSVLKPEKRDGAPDTTVDWLARSDLCLGMVAVMEATGWGQDRAAKHVATHCEKAADKIRKSVAGQRWGAIKGWHEQFSSKTAPNDIAQGAYSGNVELVKALVVSKPQELRLAAANKYLRGASEKILSN